MTDDVLTPHDLDAERAVLGAALLSDNATLDLLQHLAPGHFFRQAHQDVFLAIRALSSERKAVDGLTVRAWLEQHGKLQAVGGPAYLFGLVDGMPPTRNISAHISILKDRALRRNLQAVGRRLEVLATDADRDGLVLLDVAQAELLALADGMVKGDLRPASALVQDAFPAIERLTQSKSGVTGIATGFTDLDRLTRGLQRANLVLVAARPSMGKTALALNIAAYAATNGHRVAFFSLEMSEQELMMRLIAAIGRLDGHRLQSGIVNQTDYTRISDAMGRIADYPMWVDDTAHATVLEIRSKARRLKAREGLDLVVIDYLQLLAAERRYESRNLELGAMSRMLKGLAKELEVPVVALSQLSRKTEERGDHRPQISDLRESGSLEQDADLVLLLYRAEHYKRTPENAGQAELIIGKQRNGPTGTVHLTWLKQETRFANASDR